MKHLIVGFIVGAFLVGAAVVVKTPFLVNVTSSDKATNIKVSSNGQYNNLPPIAIAQATYLPETNSQPAPAFSTTTGNEKKTHPYRIIINIPAYKLSLYENDSIIKTYTVCVGMPGYKTPVRKMTLNRIIWNPSWAPPPNAAWARGSSAKAPGKMNPVGVVKMPIRGYVYIHGTYKIKSLGFAWSHGCIRMANDDAVELAWFLQSHVGSNHPDHTLETYTSDRRTRMIFLNQVVPVETVYETIEVENERLLIHPDVYRLGLNSPQRVMKRITSAGWTGKEINHECITQLINRSRTETAIATLDEVLNQALMGN